MNVKQWLGIAWGWLAAGMIGMASTTENLVERNNRFALELHGQLKQAGGNLIASPFSVSVVMGMAYAGAAGETAREMAETFHFAGLEPHAFFQDYLQRLREAGRRGAVEWQGAQSLWAEETFPFLKSFLELTQQFYGSELHPVDFRTRPEPVRETINQWVEKQTRDRIRNLLAPGVLDAMTRLVLVNAVYFKGKWAEPFDPALTREMAFRVMADEETTVQMMFRRGSCLYAETEEAQWLELPYGGGELSLVVILPRGDGTLEEVESRLSDAFLREGLQRLHPTEVDLLLPRFKITSTLPLNQVLQKMGMLAAFQPQQADFSGMSSEAGLYISTVIQKAFVEVNEEGTEAAAATAAIMRPTAMPAEPVSFHADHPFLFFLRERSMGGVLFMGRVVDPSRLAAD